jgi:hypothetical protein
MILDLSVIAEKIINSYLNLGTLEVRSEEGSLVGEIDSQKFFVFKSWFPNGIHHKLAIKHIDNKLIEIISNAIGYRPAIVHYENKYGNHVLTWVKGGPTSKNALKEKNLLQKLGFDQNFYLNNPKSKPLPASLRKRFLFL